MLLKLALKDLFFDRLISSCQVAAIASILAPLLLLFSLRYGIVNELENKLLQDPTVLSLTLDSSAQLDSAFFDKLLEDQDVGFVIPEVSALSALVNLHFGNRVERVAVMATAPDDPIVENSNISFDHPASRANINNVTSSNEASNAKDTSQKASQDYANSNVKQTEKQNAAQDEPQNNVSRENQVFNHGLSHPPQHSQSSVENTSSATLSSKVSSTKAVSKVGSQDPKLSQDQTNHTSSSLQADNQSVVLSSSDGATAAINIDAETTQDNLVDGGNVSESAANVTISAANTNGENQQNNELVQDLPQTPDTSTTGSVNNASITITTSDKESKNVTNENSEQTQNEQNPETIANDTSEPKVNSADVNAAAVNTSPSNSNSVNADIGAASNAANDSASNAANGSVSNVSVASTAPDKDSDLDKSGANAAQDNEQVSKTAVVVLPEVTNSIAEQRWLEGGLADDEALVTEDLARKYQIKTGDKLKVVVSRTKNGQGETKNKTFKVKGIIKQRFVNDDFLAVNLNVLKAIDDYRVGLEPAIFSDGSNIRTTKRTYAKFRLFAKNIDSVIPLYNKLIKQGLNVSSKVGQIENIQAIARVLNFIFIVIALVSGIGGALALSGLMLSSLKSRKRNFVLLRLMGQSRRETYFLVLLENVMLSSLGFILAWAFYMAGSQVFNQYFGAMLPEAVISHLTVEHGLIFYLSTVLIAALLALWSAKYIFLKAHIADVLREA